MWYVIVLALSACSNCWAMKELIKVDVSTKDIQRVSKPGEISERNLRISCFYTDAKEGEKRIDADDYLWIEKTHEEPWNAYDWGSSAARHYHLKMYQYYQTLRQACDPKEPAYEGYSEKQATHAALLKYLHEKPEITFSRTAREVKRRDSSEWVYAFKNYLISIKNDTLEDPRFLSLPNQTDHFIAYSLEHSHVYAADNTCKVYDWDTFNGWRGNPCQLPEICKQVIAMQQVDCQRAVAIFFKDKDGNKKAGFLLRRNGYGFTFSVVPSEKKSIEAITWMYDEDKKKICGSIIGDKDRVSKVVAKYIIHHWNYPDVDQYIEYIMPNPNASKDNE
jgi:hypothetical protein